MKNKNLEERWGWEIAIEMFFVGSASGAFLSLFFLQIIASIDLSTHSLRIPLILSLIGVFFLLKELGHPGRAWQSIFNLGSTISLGAIIVSAFILIMVVLLLQNKMIGTTSSNAFLMGLAALFALGSALYPGILMAEVKGRDSILSNLAPILFLASSLSTGAAWLILVGTITRIGVVIPAVFPPLNLIIFSFLLTQLVILVSWGIVVWRLGKEKWQEIRRVYEQRKEMLILVGIGIVLPMLSILIMNQTILIKAVQSCLILMSGVALRFLLLVRDPEIGLKEIRYLIQFTSRWQGK